MLAEIFMVRLEATARMSREAASADDSRFVPFSIQFETNKIAKPADGFMRAARTKVSPNAPWSPWSQGRLLVGLG